MHPFLPTNARTVHESNLLKLHELDKADGSSVGYFAETPGLFYSPTNIGADLSDMDRVSIRARPAYTPKNECRNSLSLQSMKIDFEGATDPALAGKEPLEYLIPPSHKVVPMCTENLIGSTDHRRFQDEWGYFINSRVVGLVVRISGFHPDDPGSIPGQRIFVPL